MIDNGGELAEVIKTCKERIIHVDNPPIDVKGERLKCNKENRKVLKEILLKNLIKFDETYKSKNFYRERHENLENFIGEKEKIIKQVKEIKSKLPRYDYGKKLVDCSDELVEGSVGIANLIQPDNFPISNAGGNIAKFGVKILSVGVNYVLDEKENQLIEKFKNKIKEDRENQEKYLSKLNFRLQKELKDIKEEKENYEETIKDWNNHRKELEEKIENYSQTLMQLSDSLNLGQLGHLDA
uniref:Uncharacterized protein n=1 Tax=Rhizophagus irregularis (strain DAOM 181602 / DAOM 197198 / MUCL 43194) TaxID=747089 RepID=U9UIG6_RHIID